MALARCSIARCATGFGQQKSGSDPNDKAAKVVSKKSRSKKDPADSKVRLSACTSTHARRLYRAASTLCAPLPPSLQVVNRAIDLAERQSRPDR